MLVTTKIRSEYEKIQRQIFNMIPEKWDRVYLYASVVDHYSNLQTGEMFFYYYPKSLFKVNPVNVYEVPNRFNVDEQAYLKLAEKLYNTIKELRNDFINSGEKAWSNITISIENFKFKILYNYENLQNSKYNNYDRHLIWRYNYLGTPLSSYSKKERKMIEEYILEKGNNIEKQEKVYQEGIYDKKVGNAFEYGRQNINIVSTSVNANANTSINAEDENANANASINTEDENANTNKANESIFTIGKNINTAKGSINTINDNLNAKNRKKDAVNQNISLANVGTVDERIDDNEEETVTTINQILNIN